MHEQRRERHEDEARDTFKTLKNQHIGDSNAHLYYEWAALEAKAGSISKALSIVQKGIKENAQPARCGAGECGYECRWSDRFYRLLFAQHAGWL